jgi:hypothetical protein
MCNGKKKSKKGRKTQKQDILKNKGDALQLATALFN